MKRIVAISACIALFATASVASADQPPLSLWFCVSGQGGGPPCEPCDPGNPDLFLAPVTQNDNLTTNFGTPTFYDEGSLDLMMDVNTNGGDGCGAEIIASLGLDVDATATEGTAPLTATDFTIFESAGDTNSTQDPWSGVNTAGVTGAAPDLVTDARAVAVPASDTDTLWNGYCPQFPDVTYRAASLSLTAGDLGGGEGQTVYELFMAVGDLKIVRVFDPTGTQGTTPEDVSFGYTADESMPDATVSGSDPGATSGVADAFVTIRKKGDFGSVDPNTFDLVDVPDGIVGSDDIGFFLDALGTGDNLLIFLGDFGSVDPNTFDLVPVPDCVVGSDDIGFFLDALGS